MSDGARVYMMGKRSQAGQEKDTLRRFAKKAAERYQRLLDAGSAPAHVCRMMGEAEDQRPLCHPFANLIQRFLNDLRFHHQMTAARTETGKKAWTIDDVTSMITALGLASLVAGIGG
eukprot:5413112-Pyramimonas_sp.AAC.1